ncbi:hypothetical protein GQ44DRAFT_707387 [Phaeosphaeriaceae sp. PMI808]|nr:hypothetical protein GQ44DRAFT_707387 [Phaeosphaeriaceae sp. PMI808]
MIMMTLLVFLFIMRLLDILCSDERFLDGLALACSSGLEFWQFACVIYPYDVTLPTIVLQQQNGWTRS